MVAMTTIDSDDVNEVRLRGRLAAPAQFREMPSGDTLAIFRVTVNRPANDRAKVDSLDCVNAAGRVRQALQRAEQGDTVELSGSLRRRFWRSPAGPASRYAVEVATLRAIKPGRRGVGSPARKPASA